MEINHISVNANFKYLWLKTVKGVDLEQHCARCLKAFIKLMQKQMLL